MKKGRSKDKRGKCTTIVIMDKRGHDLGAIKINKLLVPDDLTDLYDMDLQEFDYLPNIEGSQGDTIFGCRRLVQMRTKSERR